jgi:exodeoxyribonuclease-3
MQRILSRGLVDVHRRFEPDNADVFTWWAPWRNMRERNIGWRLDYVFSVAPAERAVVCEARGLGRATTVGGRCVRV